MAYQFTDEDKVEQEFAPRIDFGVHKVQLVGAEASETSDGKEFIEVHIVNKDGIEDSARVWFTGGASQISFNTLRQIIVHNAKDDETKETARQAVENCKDTPELAELLNQLSGGELWLTKYYDPVRTYQNAKGDTKQSINTNIYGYEPVLKPELTKPKGSTNPGLDNLTKGGEQVDAGGTVPGNWAK